MNIPHLSPGGSTTAVLVRYADWHCCTMEAGAKAVCKWNMHLQNAVTKCYFIWKCTLLLVPFGGLKFTCVFVHNVAYTQTHLHIPLPYKPAPVMLLCSISGMSSDVTRSPWRCSMSVCYLYNNSSVLYGTFASVCTQLGDDQMVSLHLMANTHHSGHACYCAEALCSWQDLLRKRVCCFNAIIMQFKAVFRLTRCKAILNTSYINSLVFWFVL